MDESCEICAAEAAEARRNLRLAQAVGNVLLGGCGLALAGIIGLMLVACAGPIALLRMEMRAEAWIGTVSARTWRRTVEVERFEVAHRVDPCEDLPVGATVTARSTHRPEDPTPASTPAPAPSPGLAAGSVPHASHTSHSSHPSSHHTTHHTSSSTSHDHTRSKRSGSTWYRSSRSSRSSPSRSSSSSSARTVWWCSYDIEDWVEQPALVTGGTAEPRSWAEAPPADACPEPVLGCTRTKAQQEELEVELAIPGHEEIACSVSETAWAMVEQGEPAVVWVSSLFHVPDCKSLVAGGRYEVFSAEPDVCAVADAR